MIFCRHKFIILGKYEFFDTSFGVRFPYTTYHQQCEKCGKIREETIKMHARKDTENG